VQWSTVKFYIQNLALVNRYFYIPYF